MNREVFGDYFLNELVASGEAAEVWLAENLRDEKVIIKRILPPWSTDNHLRNIFFEVVKDCALLRHSHLVSMLDFGQVDDYLYVVLDRVDGIFLRQIIRSEQVLDEKQVVTIAAGILSGLSYLHQASNPFTGKKIAHSDVSPANILVDKLGRPRVVDMGFGRLVFEAGLPGKPSVPDIRYVAPEVLSGSRTSATTDVYGAGMVIKDLLVLAGSNSLSVLESIRDKSILCSGDRYPDASYMLLDLVPLLEKYGISDDDVIVENFSGWSDGIKKVLGGSLSISEGLGFLSERYEVLSEVGRGAMGVVFKARDRTLDEELAIKFLNTEARYNLDRFHQELRLARRVNHPNVARVYHLEESSDFAYYTMEYVEGEGLDKRIMNGVSLDEALSFALQLANGLFAIHSCGVIHRDVKPANILVQDNGRAVITDFGVAKNEGEDLGITQAGTTIGTPVYMAPEQMVGKEVDQSADLYALGVILYEMLTGKRPHYGSTSVTLYMLKNNAEHEPPRRINSKISRRLEAVVLDLLQPNPANRIKTASELVGRLGRC
ncbi:MAG TPA: serine/threonine-protein kinase [Oligoflexia bacterium]|nr:serine/threonine-protein kinase [Oligoflexia bacterium]HMP47121.1 serine/threonine-protein kinase [Oligoflexia bacterium]